ncbi:hypothetical protein BJY00DRAFT_322697 [Aspergillus carlsbadensis]|nr:hypothetical protein BJY00DRAFT_322697 [Aspergillus carlsbadensis]
MSTFTPLLPPHKIANNGGPPIRVPIAPVSISAILRDNMTLSSWLLTGAILQGLAIYIFGYSTLLPSVLLITFRATDNLLMTLGITRNRYMDGVLRTKYSGQHPTPGTGTFPATPASESIVVFHLGARSNHPLGILAPGMPEITRRARSMIQAMSGDVERYGVLGVSTYRKVENDAKNESLFVFYLRDYESLHRFAHDKLHMDGVNWWTKIVKDHPHLAIHHETYVVPKGHWENIYVNSKPTGMGDTSFPVRDGEGKEDAGARELVRSPVDARSGALRSASKRLQMKWLEGAEETQGELYDRTFTD